MTQHAIEAKEFLEGYKTAYYRVIDAKEHILMCKSQILHSPHLDGIRRGLKKSDISDYMVNLEKVMAEAKKIEDKQISIMRDIRRVIEHVSNEKDRSILSYRYIDFMSLNQIASKMNMSKNAVYIRHGRALERLTWQS